MKFRLLTGVSVGLLFSALVLSCGKEDSSFSLNKQDATHETIPSNASSYEKEYTDLFIKIANDRRGSNLDLIDAIAKADLSSELQQNLMEIYFQQKVDSQEVSSL